MERINKNIFMKCGVSINRYRVIKSVICSCYNIQGEDLTLFLNNKENRYLYLLLMKQFMCLSMEDLKRDLSLRSSKSINNNIKRAEEKLLINKDFRVEYFFVEEKIQKNI